MTRLALDPTEHLCRIAGILTRFFGTSSCRVSSAALMPSSRRVAQTKLGVDASKPGSWYLRTYHLFGNMTTCWLRVAPVGGVRKFSFPRGPPLDGLVRDMASSHQNGKIRGFRSIISSYNSSASPNPSLVLSAPSLWCGRVDVSSSFERAVCFQTTGFGSTFRLYDLLFQ